MLFAIDIGGSKTRVIGSQLGHGIDEEIVFVTPQSQRVVVRELRDKIEGLAGRSGVDAIGIAAPGAIDKSKGMMLHTARLRWRNLKLVAPLQQYFNCPVTIENDAACGALAEARDGSGKQFKSFVYVTISTNIGTAICVDQKIIDTQHNSEGGHMILVPDFGDLNKSLNFADIVSGSAIQREFGMIAHDIHSPSVWQEISSRLAVGLYNLATIIQPEAIILAGGVSVNHAKFVAKVRQAWDDLPFVYPPPRLKTASHIETAPALGALLLAQDLV